MRNKSGRILNVLLAIIALFIIVFVIVWIANRGKSNENYDVVFSENIDNMQEIAKDYFAGDLPTEIGGTNLVSLGEMYELDLIGNLTYGKTSCDEDSSYISITKISNEEFKVKSNLICGIKTDNIVEKIKASTIISDEDGNVINDSSQEDIELNVTPSDQNSNTNINGTSSNSSNSQSNNSQSNSSTNSNVECVGVICEFEEIETECKTTYKYEYVKRVSYCPSGYTMTNGKCIKTLTESTAVNAGYTTTRVEITDAKVNNGGSYKEYTLPIISTTPGQTTCQNGTLKNNLCYEYAEQIVTTINKCPEGYTEKNGACYKYADSTAHTSTTYSCSSGTLDGNKCYTNAKQSYTPWGNPTSTYTTAKKESTYTYELSKKVLVGTTTRNGTTYYTYSIYKRSKTYSCSSGTLSGTKCYKNATAHTTTTYSCPAGYTKDGSTCYIKENKISTTTYSCPTGYTKDDNKCYKTSQPTTTNGTTTYTCPTGYKTEGSGINTKCYKVVQSANTYYCENSKATLVGNKCHLTITETVGAGTCPAGYTYSNNKCYRTTTQTTNPLWKNTEYVYSTQTSLPGYIKTGVATFETICTPIGYK